ncbi:hypothetical protein ACHAQH_007574 [Verticillium albo-atrum]
MNLRRQRNRGGPIISQAHSRSLERFLENQDALIPGGRLVSQTVYESAIEELEAGRKTTHWVWFVFPQLAGLGSSPTNRCFALSSVEEAHLYMEHSVLGERLMNAVLAISDNDEAGMTRVMGAVDAMKVRSSLTLFAMIMGESSVFHDVLVSSFGGQMCEDTVRMVERSSLIKDRDGIQTASR